MARIAGKPVTERRLNAGGLSRPVDPNGSLVTGQCYVQFARLAAPRFAAPAVFWHGGAMTGAVWEATPDGRPGWQSDFLRFGFDTYVCDAPGRGRAGWSPFPDIFGDAPLFRTLEEAWSLFRFGPAEGWHEDRARLRPFAGQRFPLAALETFAAQLVPRWTGHEDLMLEAQAAALERIGPAWLIAHSQGGYLALMLAARCPDLVRGVIAIEPAAAPGEIGGAATVPHLVVWGDHFAASPLWRRYRAAVEGHLDALEAAGGAVARLDLPAIGIAGNSHAPMLDDNAAAVAALVRDWIAALDPGIAPRAPDGG